MPTLVPTEIETKRCILRQYVYGDEQEIYQLIRNNQDRLKEVLLSWDYNFKNIEDVKKYITTVRAGFMLNNIYRYGIWLKEPNTLIGEKILFNIDNKTRSIEEGSFIDKKYEGKFILLEVGKACRKLIFSQLKFNAVVAKVIKGNKHSSFFLNRLEYNIINEDSGNLTFVYTSKQYFNSNSV